MRSAQVDVARPRRADLRGKPLCVDYNRAVVSSSSRIESVRMRPGMYVGNTHDGSGIDQMILELVANSYDQYLLGRCSKVSIRRTADGAITVEDDGPGIPVGGGKGLPPLETLLTELSDKPTIDGHRPHVHLGLGGLGIVIVNALSERLELVTVHDGQETRVACSRGVVIERAVSTPSGRSNGTVISFRPDATIFAWMNPTSKVGAVLDDLTFLAPGLALTWAIDGSERSASSFASAGLVGRVALQADCSVDEVAHHRKSYDTAKGAHRC